MTGKELKLGREVKGWTRAEAPYDLALSKIERTHNATEMKLSTSHGLCLFDRNALKKTL